MDMNEVGKGEYDTWHINNICHSTTVRPDSSFKSLLVYYDEIFRDLNENYYNIEAEYKEEQMETLREINSDIMLLSKKIINMSEKELADLTVYDSDKTKELSNQINQIVHKHLDKAGRKIW